MKTILVTGGNKGIGLAIVTRLLQDYPDTYLLLGSRHQGRGQAAVEQIVAMLGDKVRDRVEMVEIDVTSDQSVQEAVRTVKARHGQLYGLVNNAGGCLDSATHTVQLNTYSVRRVCEEFVGIIEKEQGNPGNPGPPVPHLFLAAKQQLYIL